jgi:hypothetical protein
MRAAIRGDRAMVAFLLAEGADPTRHVGITEQTAANYARLEHPEIALLLDRAEDEKRA